MRPEATAPPPVGLAQRLARDWYRPRLTPLTLALTPLSVGFAMASACRRMSFRIGWRHAERLPVPVVVVGNLTIGGTGKTPVVIALARALAARGWRPGVVSRGFGARASNGPRLVASSDSPDRVGDEPLLIARAGIPVAVGARRADAARVLLAAHPDCDVIVSDDGLQHYAMHRDVEIAVVDGARGMGNRWQLPAGPLREPIRRLHAVDAVLVNGGVPEGRRIEGIEMSPVELRGATLVNLRDPSRTAPATAFAGQRVHAIAGIGNPDRFFATLRGLGIDACAHAFPDHHRFVASDLAYADADAILMTEKDAVKCERFADARCWMLPVVAILEPSLVERVAAILADALPARAAARG